MSSVFLAEPLGFGIYPSAQDTTLFRVSPEIGLLPVTQQALLVVDTRLNRVPDELVSNHTALVQYVPESLFPASRQVLFFFMMSASHIFFSVLVILMLMSSIIVFSPSLMGCRVSAPF